MSRPAYYRPDIDGLRALAVLAVVFYHFGWPVTGGFTGVDVFFVISGYLITSIISRKLKENTFSFGGFYLNRVRRILPALVPVLLFSMVAGYFLLMPEDLASLGQQTLAAAFGLSNLLFYKTSGYFAPAADLLPLLHTWSLGVEEQFYLVWPAVMVAIFRFAPRLRLWMWIFLALVILGSLAVSQYLVLRDPPAAFYLPQNRAWELAVGAAIAFVPLARGSWSANIVGTLGLLSVLIAFFYTDGASFPGFGALLPCLGTAALIWSGGWRSYPARLLSIEPLRFIGLISYSLYLWHWPILVYFRYLNYETFPGPVWGVALIALSMILATLSWRYVETPVRAMRGGSGKRAASLAIAGAAVAASIGLTVKIADGLPARLPVEALNLAQDARDRSPLRSRCHQRNGYRLDPIEESCVLGAQSSDPTVIVWGDSHGIELSDALGQLLLPEGRSLYTVTRSACAPALGYAFSGSPVCQEHNLRVLNFVLAHPELRTVVLTTFWQAAYERDADDLETGLGEIVRLLSDAGREVIIVGPTPRAPYIVPNAAARLAWTSIGPRLSIPKEQFDVENRAALQFLLELSKLKGVELVDGAAIFCEGKTCRFTADGHALLFDDHHPSNRGAKALAAAILPLLKPEASLTQTHR